MKHTTQPEATPRLAMMVSAYDESAAYKAAIAAQERGEDWFTAFDACLAALGYGYTGAPCRCEDPDAGHEPACGWSRVAAS